MIVLIIPLWLYHLSSHWNINNPIEFGYSVQWCSLLFCFKLKVINNGNRRFQAVFGSGNNCSLLMIHGKHKQHYVNIKTLYVHTHSEHLNITQVARYWKSHDQEHSINKVIFVSWPETIGVFVYVCILLLLTVTTGKDLILHKLSHNTSIPLVSWLVWVAIQQLYISTLL